MTKATDALSLERLRAVLKYDPETGIFIWLYRDDRRQEWNSRYAGRDAGSTTFDGYRRITVNGCLYVAHRLAWLYMIGDWPVAEIDHINGDRIDNRFCNLREASHAENAFNRRCSPPNRSGLKGIKWVSSRSKWESSIGFQRKRIWLGYFETAEAAHAAYCKAAERYHGEFARFN